MKKRIALFAAYDSQNRINDYVIHYLTALNTIADIVFICDNFLSDVELRKIKNLTLHQICVKHGGYDFGSYKLGFQWAKSYNILNKYDSLILCNDSVFGPFYPLEPIFLAMEKREDVDFWGVFCHFKKNIPMHIQSYFIVLKKNVFCSELFENFIESVQVEKRKEDVIYKYEIGLTQALLENEYKLSALFTESKHSDLAIELIKKGFPFLKKSLFSPESPVICREIYKYKEVLSKSDIAYDIDLIESYIDRYIGKPVADKYMQEIKYNAIGRIFFKFLSFFYR